MKGYTNARIAEALGISLEGAKWHVREILEVTGASSREEAAELWRVETGLPRRLWRMTWRAGWVVAGLGAVAVASLALVAVLLALTGGDDDEAGAPGKDTATAKLSPTLTGRPTTAPTPPATTAPTTASTPPKLQSPSRTTRVAFVDYVTAHLESNVPLQPADLSGQSLPCVFEVFNTAPKCPAGAAEGSLVLSIITFQCEIGWNELTAAAGALTRPDDQLSLDSILQSGMAYTRPPAVTAVPDYWMLFRNSAPALPAGFAVAIKDDKIVSFGRSCGTFESLATRRSEGSTGYLLPPP